MCPLSNMVVAQLMTSSQLQPTARSGTSIHRHASQLNDGLRCGCSSRPRTCREFALAGRQGSLHTAVSRCAAVLTVSGTKTKKKCGYGRQSRPGCRRKHDLPVVASPSNGLLLKRKQTEWTRTYAAGDGQATVVHMAVARRGRQARVVGDRQMAVASITDSATQPTNWRVHVYSQSIIG